MKTEFILCQQFSALKVSDVTGNAAHRPEPHTTSAKTTGKLRLLHSAAMEAPSSLLVGTLRRL